jgi:1-phosphofructokinase
MIYTVTLNPSIDYVVHVENFHLNQVNRIKDEQKFPGGKGINVSRVLCRMGINTTALGFIGGFTGKFIKDALLSEGVHTDFIPLEEDSRINIKLKSNGVETEINGTGPSISEKHFLSLLDRLDSLKTGSIVVFAGSVPASLPKTLYPTLVQRCHQRGLKVVIDTSGKGLLDSIPHHPFLIKPNHHELSELFEVDCQTVDEIIPLGLKLIQMGAQNVIVSMAGDGALFFTDETVYFAHVPKGKVINSVGAGDSLVAGFIGTYSLTKNKLDAFRYGVAAGSATAFSADLCTKAQIEGLLPHVKIEKLRGDGK